MNRRKPEQIVTLLHQAAAALGQGKTVEDICREQGISPATYHRWRQKYGGLGIQDAKRIKREYLGILVSHSILAQDVVALLTKILNH